MSRKNRSLARRPMMGSAPVVVEFTPDYTYIKRDLRRIGILAGLFFAVLVGLSVFLR